MTNPGDRYRNTTGRTLYGFFPPDAVVTVRDDGHGDNLVTLEYDPDDGTHVRNAVVVQPGSLDENFEFVEAAPDEAEESDPAALRAQVRDLTAQLAAERNSARGESEVTRG